jgi:hypothetical protein
MIRLDEAVLRYQSNRLNRYICFSIFDNVALDFSDVSTHVLAGSGVLGPGLGLEE